MTRMVFLMEVKPDQIEPYRAAHQAVWPEVLAALSRVGIRNYSIFMADTHLVAYFEAEDCRKSWELLTQEPALHRWWQYMDPVMAEEPPLARDFQEVFHLA